MMLWIKHVLCASLLFLMTCGLVWGEATSAEEQTSEHIGPITIKTEVDRNKIMLGDIFTYSIIIRHDPKVKVSLPGWGANVGQFEIRDYQLDQRQEEDGHLLSQSRYSLAIYDTGTFTIPPVAVGYSLQDGEEQLTLLSDSVDIEVESIASSEATDIKGLKQQAVIPPDYRLLYLGIAAILALMVIAAGLLYYFKKIRRVKGADQEIYLGPPHEVALKELEALLAKNLLGQGQIKQFYFELSEIIRRYLGRRFQIYTLERTTAEIVGQIEGLYLAQDIYAIIITFLDDTDLVKFAKYIPGSRENEGVIEMARTIIDKTRIVTDTGQLVGQSDDTLKTVTNENDQSGPAHKSPEAAGEVHADGQRQDESADYINKEIAGP